MVLSGKTEDSPIVEELKPTEESDHALEYTKLHHETMQVDGINTLYWYVKQRNEIIIVIDKD